MRVILAPDSFKESLGAADAAAAMARGVKRAVADAQIDLCPIADGGEGTVEAMLSATDGRPRLTRVTGPLGEPVEARWGVLGTGDGAAVMEMASAAGLALVPTDRRDPTKTTTHGVGELIRAALDVGAKRILLGIGGSATTDGGTGMAQALGVRFLDAGGNVIKQPMAGGLLASVAKIDMAGLDPRIAATTITVACDVTNPLTGPNGAAAIYGPQKGATPAQVKLLDDALAHLAGLLKEQVGADIQTLPGSGAAGGLGGGLVGFLNATLQKGIGLVLEAVRFEQRVAGCDLCLTGEGRLDGQSLSGKACLGVAQAATRHRVPTIALVGSLGSHAERTLEAGLKAYHVIGEGLPAAESMRRCAELLERAAHKVCLASARHTGSKRIMRDE